MSLHLIFMTYISKALIILRSRTNIILANHDAEVPTMNISSIFSLVTPLTRRFLLHSRTFFAFIYWLTSDLPFYAMQRVPSTARASYLRSSQILSTWVFSAMYLAGRWKKFHILVVIDSSITILTHCQTCYVKILHGFLFCLQIPGATYEWIDNFFLPHNVLQPWLWKFML